MKRAYSQISIKSIDDERRIIEGVASTPVTDRLGDVVESMGAQFKLPLPLLWQHDSHQPIGHVTAAKVTKDGIAITAQIAKGLLPRIDEAWTLIKAGLVRGLSIGFKPIEMEEIKGTWGMRYLKWDWLELSAVTIPANQDASIFAIKSAYLRRAPPADAPMPNDNETHDDFMARCQEHPAMMDEPAGDRAAMCEIMWGKKKSAASRATHGAQSRRPNAGNGSPDASGTKRPAPRRVFFPE